LKTGILSGDVLCVEVTAGRWSEINVADRIGQPFHVQLLGIGSGFLIDAFGLYWLWASLGDGRAGHDGTAT
jgi:hypothetical protein